MDTDFLSKVVLMGWLTLMEEIPEKHHEDLCFAYAQLFKDAGVPLKTSRESGLYNGNWPLFNTWDTTVREINGN